MRQPPVAATIPNRVNKIRYKNRKFSAVGSAVLTRRPRSEATTRRFTQSSMTRSSQPDQFPLFAATAKWPTGSAVGRTAPADGPARAMLVLYNEHGSAVPTSAHPRSAARDVNLAPVFRQERPPHRNKAARTPPDLRADEAGSSPATAVKTAEADISDPPNGRCRLEG